MRHNAAVLRMSGGKAAAVVVVVLNGPMSGAVSNEWYSGVNIDAEAARRLRLVARDHLCS